MSSSRARKSLLEIEGVSLESIIDDIQSTKSLMIIP